MKTKAVCLFVSMVCIPWFALRAQVGGNALYGSPKSQGVVAPVSDLSASEPKGSVPISFIEANILLNLKADAYQAVFALAQEGSALKDANDKLTAQAKEFISALEELGVKKGDIFVDFVSQNRIYDFNVQDNVAREKLSGFEVKKNVIVRYQNAALLDRMLAAAAKSAIFDLVKVDYIVADMTGARARLLEEAAKVIRNKEASYGKLFGVKLGHASIAQEKYGSNFPADMYRSYTAYESGNADSYNMRVVHSRKVSTSYYSPLDPTGLDSVINPAGVEPAVQLTLALRVKYR